MGLDPAYWNLQAPGGRLFADPAPGADETSFQVDNTSKAYYSSLYYKLHQDDLQPVPTPKVGRPRFDLAKVLGSRGRANVRCAVCASSSATRGSHSSTGFHRCSRPNLLTVETAASPKVAG
jgi:hypothetical protein